MASALKCSNIIPPVLWVIALGLPVVPDVNNIHIGWSNGTPLNFIWTDFALNWKLWWLFRSKYALSESKLSFNFSIVELTSIDFPL